MKTPGAAFAVAAFLVAGPAAARAQMDTQTRDSMYIAAARAVSVAALDSTLPVVRLDDWLAGLVASPTKATWEVNDCGEGGDGRSAPFCVEVAVELARDTTAHLVLAVASADGKLGPVEVFDMFVLHGRTATGVKSLGAWAALVRARGRPAS